MVDTSVSSLITSAIINSLDVEHQLVQHQNPTKAENIETFIVSLSYSPLKYTLFTLARLQDISDKIFSTPELRDFILNVTDRSLFVLETSGIDFQSQIIKPVSSSLERSRNTDLNISFSNHELHSTLHTESGIFETLFTHNPWLLVLYIIQMYYFDSKLYQVRAEINANKRQ